jgi:hypothetical protein
MIPPPVAAPETRARNNLQHEAFTLADATFQQILLTIGAKPQIQERL